MTYTFLDKLRARRARYQDFVEAYLRPQTRTEDMAISVEGMAWIIRKLTELQVVRVLDMGMGWSTLELARWADTDLHRTPAFLGVVSPRLVTAVDHDPTWMSFMRGLMRADLDLRESERVRLLVRDALDPQGAHVDLGGPFGAIIVDHKDSSGDALDRRAADVPYLVEQLDPKGILLFDDWRPKHEGRIRRALAAVGGSWTIGSEPESFSKAHGKGIGWAVRA